MLCEKCSIKKVKSIFDEPRPWKRVDEIIGKLWSLTNSTGVKPLTNLGSVHSKHMFLCGFVLAGVAPTALSHHQHEVLSTASKHHQALVRMGQQWFLNVKGKCTD